MEGPAVAPVLVRLVVGIVLGRWETVRSARQEAGPGEPDRVWREAVLQTHLFAGFPRLVEAWRILDEEGGLGVLDPDELEEPDEDGGRVLFDRIYAGQAQKVRETLTARHPLLARWIAEHAYGRVLARPGLAPHQREILAVVSLAAQGQWLQLESHARGALRSGATSEQLEAGLAQVEDLLEEDLLARASEILARL